MKIYTNIRQHLNDFIRLNELWITEHFQLEENDQKLAENPESVIDSGGFIFTGVLNNKVVGTSALFVKEYEFELARMAVDPAFRGRGYGRLMGQQVIDVAMQIGADELKLYTHDQLEPAVNLYRSLGFEPIHNGPHGEYCRCNLVMAKQLVPQTIQQ